MSARVRWWTWNAGPAIFSVAVGVWLALTFDPWWFGAGYAAIGLVALAGVGNTLAHYRQGYWRGRAEAVLGLSKPVRENPWDPLSGPKGPST